MKTVNRLLLTGMAFLAGSILASATQWQYKSLNELIAEADLVVVGKIESDKGRVKPPPANKEASLAYTWTAKLKISRYLKGSTTGNEVTVHWDEIRLSGAPDYTPGEERIWILKKWVGAEEYSTSGRPDTVLLLKELAAVEVELNKPGFKPAESKSPQSSAALERAKRFSASAVKFDGLPLAIVITMLHDESVKRDATGKGVTISLAPDAKDLADTEINLELKDVTLAEVLNRVADLAGLEVQANETELLLTRKKAKQ